MAISVASSLGMTTSIKIATALDYELLAEMALEDSLHEEDMIGIDVQLEAYLLDSEIGRQSREARVFDEAPVRKIVADYLKVHKEMAPRQVLHDEEAMFWMISRAMHDDRVVHEDPVSRSARVAAYDLIYHQLISQKVAPGAFKRAFSSTPMRGPIPDGLARAAQWAEAAEGLLLRSHPMWVKYCRLWAAPPRKIREHLRRMIDKVSESPASERHRTSTMSSVLHGCRSYNYAGVLVIYHESVMLILDNSAADYLRTCMTSLRNAAWAFSMMRVSADTMPSNYMPSYLRCLAWIRRAISNTHQARNVARHMHLSYTRWQNSTCEAQAPIDCGWAQRDQQLTKDILAYYPHNTQWYDLVMSLPVPERVKAEFLKLYHLLPPPDIDPLLLHQTLVERTSTANTCQSGPLDRFIQFCKSYDLCRFLSKRHADPKTAMEPGYVASDQDWYKKSKSGRLTMPPKKDWGRAWIEKEFAYDPTGDFHIFDAKDCTRIVADLDAYMSRCRSRELSRVDQNELLSAIFNGARLSNGEMMTDWRARVMAGDVRPTDNIIAAEAGKAENTKPGSKVRETLSASDIAREFLTEVDHSLRPLAEMTPGVSIRVDMVRHKKKFQAMARATSADSLSQAFATSTDISGWSPKMPRKMFHAWQEYALTTTECPNPKAPAKLWDQLILFCDRRGVKESAPCPEGNIQGWPATSDTTMHAHILIYWAYELRDRKILSAKEAAYILCLIDDAATVVALEGSAEECTKKAQAARELLAHIYSQLGFEMDEVKSFFSSIKFVYLNELYIDGTQVAHATKTIMRIDKDYTRRFASFTDNIATAFGTASSAAAQGADPFVAYYMAAWLAFQWLFKIDRRFMAMPTYLLTIIALAPVSLNGMGIKAITSAMATGEMDHLTWFIEIAGHFCNLIESDQANNLFNSLLLQPPAERDARSVFMNPHSYTASSHLSAATAIRSMFRDAAREQGMAEPFRTLDRVERSDEYCAAVEKVLKSGSHEAALLEEVASCMPEALIDELMGRVDRTELVTYMMGARAVGNARRQVLACDQHNLIVVADLAMASMQSHGTINMVAEYATRGSFQVASDLRESSYAHLGYKILNHTYPCPFSLWAFHGEIDLESSLAPRLTTVSFDLRRLRQTAGSNSKNLYDSSTMGIGYKGYRTMKSNVANEVRVALYNPVRKRVAQGLAAFRWAEDMGAHHVALFELFTHAWCGTSDLRLLNLPGKRFQGSAKRLSLRHSKTNHAITMFPNCQAAVRVNAKAVTVHHANTGTMFDMMAAITALRCAGLLEAALAVRNRSGVFAYGFGYKELEPGGIQGRVDIPAEPESGLEPGALDCVTPFTEIDSELQSAARVACSYASMSSALAAYAEGGARAAERVYNAALNDAEMEGAVVEAHTVVARQIQVVAMSTRYADIARPWGMPIARPRPQSAGAVTSDSRGQSSASGLLIAHPDIAPDKQLQSLGSSWADSLALDLVHEDAMFANEIYICYHSHRTSSVVQLEDWSTKAHLVRPRPHELRAIIREVEEMRGAYTIIEGLSLCLRCMGASGFRASAETTDVFHAADSFLSTSAALIGLCRAIGKSMDNLRHRSSEGYSSVSVTQAPVAIRMVARVLSAQWLFAAARRQRRTNLAMQAGIRRDNVTLENYESAFLRAASRALGATGRMYSDRFNMELVSQAIRSVRRRIHPEDAQDTFTAQVDESALEEIGADWTDDDLVQRVVEVTTLAQAHGATVDTHIALAALRNVMEWVRADIEGAHRALPHSRRGTRVITSQIIPAMPRLEEAGPSTTQDTSGTIEIPAPIIGDDQAAVDDVRSADPHQLVQWVMDTATRREAMRPAGYVGNIHLFYDQVTRTREAYDSFLDFVCATLDINQYEDPEFSAFPPVNFEDEEDNVVAD